MAEKQTFKAWITKYALTTGIYPATVSTCENTKMVSVKGTQFPTYHHKPDWHTDRKDALSRALALITHKQASLKKKQDKLAALQENYESELQSELKGMK